MTIKAKKSTTKKATSKKKDFPVEIICIVDRSGSMQTLHNDVIGGINSFIADQKKIKGKANLTLIEFDNEYNVIQKRQNLKNAKEVTKDNFVPRGMTALNDAIGKTVTEFAELKKNKKINKAIFCIMTDGAENSSHEFRDKKVLKALIEQVQKDHKWEFIYLGANQDAFTEGQAYGFAQTQNYAATSAGVGDALRSFAASTTTYRSSGNT
jgi:Mg-chelatase subunit ChlD